MRSAACMSMGARRVWDKEPPGVSDGVAVRPSCRTEGCSEGVAARSPPGRWRRWRQETENDEVARRREPSEQRKR